MRRRSHRLARWISYGALLSGCSTWVDLETPKPSAASSGGTGSAGTAAAAGVGGTASNSAGSGAMAMDPPGVAPVGGSTSDEGGNSSGGAANAPDPRLLDLLEAPIPPAFIPSWAEGVDGTWTAFTNIVGGHLGGVLLGTASYNFEPTDPSAANRGGMSLPFLWTDAGGMVMLDRLFPDVDTYEPLYVNDDGTMVMGKYHSNRDMNEHGVFRWTPSGGAIKLGPSDGDAAKVFVSKKGDVFVWDYVASEVGTPDKVVRWTAETGLQTISETTGWPVGVLEQLSDDGSTLVGVADSGRIFRWTVARGLELLESPPGTRCFLSFRDFLSPDGKALFGGCGPAGEQPRTSDAYLWSEAEGFTAIQSEDKSCVMKHEGSFAPSESVAFGPALCGTEWRLMRWSTGSPPTLIPASAESGLSFEHAYFAAADDSGTSACGSVCQEDEQHTISSCVAFQFSAEAGYVRLPKPTAEVQTSALAIDRTGLVLAGFSEIGDEALSLRAVLWDSTEALDIQAYLKARGVDLRGNQLMRASEVSIQGDTVLVWGQNFGGPAYDWIARIPRIR